MRSYLGEIERLWKNGETYAFEEFVKSVKFIGLNVYWLKFKGFLNVYLFSPFHGRDLANTFQ